MSKVCGICGAEHYTKGLCKKHYFQEYSQRPEVKERKKAYYQRLKIKEKEKQGERVLVIDWFEKDQPITLEELCAKSGRDREFVLQLLEKYQRLDLVHQIGENLFKLNPDSPLRLAADSYFKETNGET